MIMNQEIEEPSKQRCKEDEKVLTATIERGAPEGFEITFPRASEQSPGVVPGDVKVKLKAAKHAVFRRNGTNDLLMRMNIPLRQALLGFERVIRHLDGHPVTISHHGIANHGQMLTLKGEGMPVHGFPAEFGQLHVELAIKMPKGLTEAERDFVGRNFEPPAEERPRRK